MSIVLTGIFVTGETMAALELEAQKKANKFFGENAGRIILKRTTDISEISGGKYGCYYHAELEG